MGCSASSSSQWSAVVCPDANGSASNCVRLESFATTDGVRRRAASCELPRISIVEADAATASAAATAAHTAKPSTACSSRCHFRTIATCTKSEVEAAASAAAYRPPNLTELSNSRMQWLDLPSPKRKNGKRFRSTLWFLESAGFSLFRSNRITQVPYKSRAPTLLLVFTEHFITVSYRMKFGIVHSWCHFAPTA